MRNPAYLLLFIMMLSLAGWPMPHTQALAASQPKSVGPEMSAALDELKELLVGGELEEALAKAREQSAKPDLTKYESYVIHSLIASVLVNLQAYSAAADALDTALATGEVPDKDLPNQLKAIAALYYNGADYEKSIAVGERFFKQTGGETDVQILVMIAQAEFVLQDYKEASSRIQQAIAQADATNEEVDKRWLLLWIASASEIGNAKDTATALKEFSRRFPDANYHLEWRLFPLLKERPPVEL